MSLPDVSPAFSEWDTDITLKVVRRSVQDFEAVETPYDEVYFPGVLQPIPPRKLIVKPEGERAWNWFTLWTRKMLTPDAILQDDAGRQYRVMSVTAWGAGGNYSEYELTEQPVTVPQ